LRAISQSSNRVRGNWIACGRSVLVNQVFLEAISELRVSERQLGCQKLRRHFGQPDGVNAVSVGRSRQRQVPLPARVKPRRSQNPATPENSARGLQSIRFTRSIRPK
jgi:hypothetical protein